MSDEEERAFETLLPDPELRRPIADANSAVARLIADRGWPVHVLASLMPLHFAAWASPYVHLVLAHPGTEMPFGVDGPEPLLVEHGYLPIGFCGNGDSIAVDCTRQVGAVVYVSHEEFDYDDPETIPEITRVVAASPGHYLLMLRRREAPLDYFDDPAGD